MSTRLVTSETGHLDPGYSRYVYNWNSPRPLFFFLSHFWISVLRILSEAEALASIARLVSASLPLFKVGSQILFPLLSSICFDWFLWLVNFVVLSGFLEMDSDLDPLFQCSRLLFPFSVCPFFALC